MTIEPTPYEQFLRQTIEDQKSELDKLYIEFAHANPIRKRLLKQQIERVNQNIALVSTDLEKYSSGLGWLREKSKERDHKAERLKEVPKEDIEKAAGGGHTIPPVSATPGAAPKPYAQTATPKPTQPGAALTVPPRPIPPRPIAPAAPAAQVKPPVLQTTQRPPPQAPQIRPPQVTAQPPKPSTTSQPLTSQPSAQAQQKPAKEKKEEDPNEEKGRESYSSS